MLGIPYLQLVSSQQSASSEVHLQLGSLPVALPPPHQAPPRATATGTAVLLTVVAVMKGVAASSLRQAWAALKAEGSATRVARVVRLEEAEGGAERTVW